MAGAEHRDPNVARTLNRRSLVAVLGFGAVTCILAPLAYMAMLSAFQAYDDEGYMLVTLRDYLSGHPAVTPFVQLYGPFFYEVTGGVYRVLGIEPGHDNGRLLTAAVWLLASLLGGIAGYRLTRNLWLGFGSQVVTFIVLTVLAAEPLTTYGLLSFMVAGLVLASTFAHSRPRAAAAVIGGIVAALCLVKINVGAFAGAAVLFAWAQSLPAHTRRRLAPVVAGVVIALPPVLMAGLLAHQWVLELAAVPSASAAAVAVVWLTSGPQAPPPASTGWLVAGGAIVAVGCLGVALLGGTTATDLWNGLIVAAVRFPGLFVLPVAISPGNVLWAAICLAAAISLNGRFAASAASPGFGVVRVWAGVLMWLAVLREPSSIFLLGLPLAWMAAQAPRDVAAAPDAYPRLLLPMLAVLAGLQVYPVGGTQLGLAALPLVPLGAMILNDGVRQLRSAGAPPAAVRIARWASPGALAPGLAWLALLALLTVEAFAHETPLDLPGSHALRLPPAQAADLRALTAAIDRDCSSFVTFPGMNSLYVWTRQGPPTEVRYGLWWLSLDSAQQESIVRELQDRPRLCVVENRKLNDFWAQGRPIPRRPLVDFIDRNFRESGSFGDYQLLVRVAG